MIKGLILLIFTLTFSCGYGQDSIAYVLFNSSYAADHYILVDKADSYFLDTTTNNVIIQECKRIIPKSLLKTMVDKKSIPFKWDKIKLQKTTVISDTTGSIEDKQYLTLSSPIFDSTKTFAIIHETFDAISCIHSGPVLFQYKDKKWTRVASQITSYHVARGLALPRGK